MLILSDDYAEDDLIGHSIYRDGLVEVIRSVHSKGSFTLGIYGQWGLGKTSILRQVKKTLDNSYYDGDQPIHTVWFNPWQFVAEKHLIIPFFHTLIASFEKIAEQPSNNKIKNFLSKLIDIPLALIYGMETEFKLPYLMNAKLSISKAVDYLTERAEERNKEQSCKDEHDVSTMAKKYESIYYNLISILHDGASDLDAKVVVFVDDLDRCLPEKSVELLEGLKVLLDIPNFIFVIGVAQEVIERGIRVRYREIYKDDSLDKLSHAEVQYLDKIIQFPFSLPVANSEKLKENILRPHLIKLKGGEIFVDLIYEVLGSNPRTLKRFMNAVSFALYLAEKKFEGSSDFRLELLIKISLIGYLFPSLYRQLEQFPGLLVRLQNIILEIEEETRKKIDSSNEVFLGSYSSVVKKTDLPMIDHWLEEDKIEKLVQILKIRNDLQDPSKQQFLGFNDHLIVSKYVRLLATSLQSEIKSKTKNITILDKPISREMQDRMTLIPIGKFMMGDDNTNIVEIEINQSFFMDKYPVTQALYKKVMNRNPSYFKGDDLPVENISWYDAVEFCNELSLQVGLEKIYDVNEKNVTINYEKVGYRLPSEAEWEYACRGNTQVYNPSELEYIAWYSKNSGNETKGVGQKIANAFGLYDMLGNVWEWCNDWFAKKYMDDSQNVLLGPQSGTFRVLRGGSWVNFAETIKPTYRYKQNPDIRENNQGIRLVLQTKEK